jgi:hypothetical protein
VANKIFLSQVGKFLFNRVDKKLFQIEKEEIVCGIKTIKTAEGLYLTTDTSLDHLPAAKADFKLIDELLLSEIDFSSYEMFNIITSLNQLVNKKFCHFSGWFTL